MSEKKKGVVFLDGICSSMSLKKKAGGVKKTTKKTAVYSGSDDLFRRKTSVVTNYKTTGTKTIHEMVQQMLKTGTKDQTRSGSSQQTKGLADEKKKSDAVTLNSFVKKTAEDETLLVSSGSESVEEVFSKELREENQNTRLASFQDHTATTIVTVDFGEALKSVLLLKEQLLLLQQQNETILKEKVQLEQLVKRHEMMIGLLEKDNAMKTRLLFREKQFE